MLTVSLPDQDWLDDVGALDGVDLVLWDPDGHPPDAPVDVFVAPYMASPTVFDVVSAQPSVRLVQVLSAGYDGIPERLPEGVALANAKGVHDAATSELAVALVLASRRGLDDVAAHQAEGVWHQGDFRPGLADARVLILGYGSVGQAIARRLAPFEVALTAVATTARDGDDLVERIHAIDELADLLPDHDVVISVLPSTDATTGILDEAVLAAMPDGGLLVNVGRGTALDTDAALRHAGRIRLALDVTDPEPLPDGHPLFSAPGVIISPHVGGRTDAFRPRALALLRDQLGRLARGEEPVNVVSDG